MLQRAFETLQLLRWLTFCGMLFTGRICIKYILPTTGQCSNQRNLQYRIQAPTCACKYLYKGSFFVLHATLNVCISTKVTDIVPVRSTGPPARVIYKHCR